MRERIQRGELKMKDLWQKAELNWEVGGVKRGEREKDIEK